MEGSTIAAILTGVLALVGALATAWMSGWNEERIEARKGRKILARYSAPLLIAAWDLANWFYDITEEDNYSPKRCKAYGDGWSSQFTSYLLGQYFASVYVIREKTQFFANLKDSRAEDLKKLLWKIQDEFVSMHYNGRESLEMRWFEGDILAAQERLTTIGDEDGNPTELRVMGWVEFKKNYQPKDNEPSALKQLFEWYEDEFQRIIYRRFKHLYSTKLQWKGKKNPQDYQSLKDDLSVEVEIEGLTEEEKEIRREELAKLSDEEKKIRKSKLEKLNKEEKKIMKELEQDPEVGIVIPDHRIRRVQHLLSDLVELLDEVSAMRFGRPVRRCTMRIETKKPRDGNPLGLEVFDGQVPCDCNDKEVCNSNPDFEHRHLPPSKGWKGLAKKAQSSLLHPRVRPDDSIHKRRNTEKYGEGQC